MYRYDLVVIGAGIIGLSCAYHMKVEHPEADILVLDKADHAGSGDTSKSAGAVRNTFTSKVNYLLADTSLDFYTHVQRDLQFNLDLEFVGYLWLLTEEQYQVFNGLMKSMIDKGIQFKIWSKEDLHEKVGGLCLEFGFDDEEARALGLGNISAGVQGVKCGTIAPELVTRFYERELQDFGVKSCITAKSLHSWGLKMDSNGQKSIGSGRTRVSKESGQGKAIFSPRLP